MDGVNDRAFPSKLSFHFLGKADFIPFLWWLLVPCQGEVATKVSRCTLEVMTSLGDRDSSNITSK